MENLIKLRKSAKKTQQDLADYLGVSRQAYANYENDTRKPDYETLLKLAEYFSVSIDWLLRGKENPTIDGRPNLDDADFAFYERYSRLSDDEKEDMRDYLELMENRRKRREKGE